MNAVAKLFEGESGVFQEIMHIQNLGYCINADALGDVKEHFPFRRFAPLQNKVQRKGGLSIMNVKIAPA